MTEYLKPESNSEEETPKETEAPKQLSQDELRKRYLEQQRRQSCPGCGEGPEFF